MQKEKVQKIIAPAGCGKTTRLLEIVEDMLSAGASPERIVFTSFTRTGAYEARDRACAKFHLKPTQLPFFRTMHSLCYRLWGNPKLMTTKDWFNLAHICKVSFSPQASSDSIEDTPLTWVRTRKGDDMIGMINYHRNTKMPLKEVYLKFKGQHVFDFSELEIVAQELHNYKVVNNKVDFTDVLEHFVETKPRLSIDYVIVDEAQDLTQLQWQVIEHLGSGAKKVVVAGDDCQAIYEYAGANPKHLVDLLGVMEIRDQSFRVPRAVQEVANKIIDKIKVKIDKKIQPRDLDGHLYREADINKMDLSEGEWLILIRNKCYARWIEPRLIDKGWAYDIQRPAYHYPQYNGFINWHLLTTKGKPIKRDDLISAMKFMSVKEQYKRGFMKELQKEPEDSTFSVTQLLDHGFNRVDPLHKQFTRFKIDPVTYQFARRCIKNNDLTPRIKISTIHAIKGSECDNVIVIPDMTQKSYASYKEDPDAEHRLFYVATTRAKESLYLHKPVTERHYNYDI